MIWRICLRCWRIGPRDAITADGVVQLLSAPRDNLIRSPYNWRTSDLKRWAASELPQLHRSVKQAVFIKDGRDIEGGIDEAKGVRVYALRRRVDVKLLPSDRFRRQGMIEDEHVRATGGRVLQPSNRQQNFLGEAMVWMQLQHENICPLLGIHFLRARSPNSAYPTFLRSLVLPWMDGGSCVDYVRTHPNADRLNIVSMGPFVKPY